MVMNMHAVALGRLGGLRGGPARAASLSRSERSAIARAGARARWGVRVLDMKVREDRWVRAAQVARRSGADVGLVEQVLFLQTLPPWERLARGIGRSRLGKVSRA